MTREEQLLWRQTAFVGVTFSFVAILSFFGTTLIGLNAQYFEEAITRNRAPALFEIHNTFDYIYVALVVGFFFSMRFVIAGVLALMLRRILIPPQYILLHQLVLVGVIGLIIGTTFNLMLILYGQLYADDEMRAFSGAIMRVGFLVLTHFAVLVGSCLAIGAYLGRTLPRFITYVVGFLMLLGFWMPLLGLNPKTPLLIGILPVMLALVLITAQVAMVAFSSAEDATMTTR